MGYSLAPRLPKHAIAVISPCHINIKPDPTHAEVRFVSTTAQTLGLHTQIPFDDLTIIVQVSRCSLIDHMAIIDDIAAISQ